MCVCVSDRQTFYHDVKTQHIIHGWIQNLSGHVTVINSNSSEAGIGLGARNRAFRTSKSCLEHRFGNRFVYVSWQRKRVIITFIIQNYVIIAFEISMVTLGNNQLLS